MNFKNWGTPITLVMVGGLVLTGCAADRGGQSSGSVSGSDAELATTTPAPVGEIDKVVWNNPYGEPATIDPAKGLNYPENLVTANLCEPLFQQQPDFSVKPNLAESAEQIDEQTYVLKIREGVNFWDGTPMTADDVVYSLTRHLDASEGSYWATDASIMSKVEKTGDWEVTVALTKPDAIFTDLLTTPVGVVVSEEYRAAAGENHGNPEAGVQCTGPFAYVPGDWKQGQSITLQRNENYWNADKKAKAGSVEIGFVVDPTASGNGLGAGEIQGSYDVPLPALAQLESSGTGTLYNGKGTQIMAVISSGEGVFGDPAVRRALTMATDREAIAQTVYEGTASSAKSLVSDAAWGLYPDAAQLREESLPNLGFDVEAAKQELEKAEVDLSKPIKIAYPSERSFYADILNEMANGAKELGLTLEPAGVPSAQFGAFFSDPAARAGYDGWVTTNFPSSSEPVNYLKKIAGTGSDQNYSGFSDPAVDEAIAAARAETDPEKRGELSVKVEQLVMEQQPWVPVVVLNSRLYLDQSVTGAPASFVYLNYPWAADLGAAE